MNENKIFRAKKSVKNLLLSLTEGYLTEAQFNQEISATATELEIQADEMAALVHQEKISALKDELYHVMSLSFDGALGSTQGVQEIKSKLIGLGMTETEFQQLSEEYIADIAMARDEAGGIVVGE